MDIEDVLRALFAVFIVCVFFAAVISLAFGIDFLISIVIMAVLIIFVGLSGTVLVNL